MFNESEIFFSCPFCGEEISMLVEELYGGQSYIEDCQVCCRPIKLSYRVEGGNVTDIRVDRS